MGLLDKAKGFLDDHKDQIQQGVDKAKDAVNKAGDSVSRAAANRLSNTGTSTPVGDDATPAPDGTEDASGQAR